MERLPRQQSAENHAPHGRRVHPAIFAPRATEWVPPHSLLRVPRQSTPQEEVGALPPTSRHGFSKERLCRAHDSRRSRIARQLRVQLFHCGCLYHCNFSPLLVLTTCCISPPSL